METAALIPIKRFDAAKARLAPVLGEGDRVRLARWLAARVIAAAAPLPVFVACDDDTVASWAESNGAGVLWGPGLGLNGAIDAGIATLAGKGASHVLIAHGDLAVPEALASVPVHDTVVLTPDRVKDGTNVMCRPTDVSLPAQYGAGSFAKHFAAAMETDRPIQVRIDPALSIDIDTVHDCRHPAARSVLAPFLGEAMPR